MSLRIKPLSKIPSQFWLKKYYYLRAGFLMIWVVIALTFAMQSPDLATILIIIYPAWDALANYFDANKSGISGKHRLQVINIIVSFITTLTIIFSLIISIHGVMILFGEWAVLSGLLQTGTAVQRLKSNDAQWSMILSGAQSVLAGAFFIFHSRISLSSYIIYVAGYAASGAIFFLISALILSFILSKE